MRTIKSIKNITYGVATQIVILLLGFISRKIILDQLGYEILGVQGLFQNLISLLNISDCGIGLAIICTLYKPLALNNRPEISSLLYFYKKVYLFLALLVFIIGIIILPFLSSLVKNSVFPINTLRIVFIIFVFDIIVSYLFSYKRSLLLADQNGYVLSLCYMIFNIGVILTQIFIAKYYYNIILFFSARLVFRIVENTMLSFVADYKYPYLKNKNTEKLSPGFRRKIIDNTKALAFHYVGNYLTGGINNIVISAFIGLTAVGVYGNYSLLIVAATMIISQFSNGITASFGNMIALENEEKIIDVFEIVFFLNFVIYNTAGVTALVLITPFISMWMGETGVLPDIAVFLIVLNFYLIGISQPLGAIRASAGIFQPDKYLHILIAGLNIFLSVSLVKVFGLPGVFIGSTVCILIKEISVLPHIVYKYLFGKTPRSYYKLLILFISTTIVSFILVYNITKHINFGNKILEFTLKCLVCCLVPNIVVTLLWFRSKYYYDIVKILKRFKLFA